MLKATTRLFFPILFIWDLPQNILGLIVLAVYKKRNKVVSTRQSGRRLYIETPGTGVSLGWLVFWTSAGNRFTHLENDCLLHEYGHARQSALLGPLYLVIVGIPSVLRALYSRWHKKRFGKRWENYFNGFPENWADRLGGVISEEKYRN